MNSENFSSFNYLNGIWGTSSTNVFAVGYDIFHYDGNQWTTKMENFNSQGSFVDIWGSSNTDVFVAANHDDIILHYDGNQWTLSRGGVIGFSGLWGTSSTDLFALGNYGTIFHYDGNQWNTMNSGMLDYHLSGIWGSSGTDVFAIGWDGTICHYDGNQWTMMISETNPVHNGIWGTSNTDVFAVGPKGTILHYDGNQWSTMITGTDADLNDIWGTSNTDVFAVGYEGRILHYNGNQWTTMISGTNADLRDIWGISSSHVFAVGTAVISPSCIILNGVCPYEGIVLHYDGNQWTTMTSLAFTSFTGIWGNSNTNLFAISNQVTKGLNTNKVFHYNGDNLTTTTITSTLNSSFLFLDEIWGSPEGDVFATSNQGILRCTSCQPQPAEVQKYLPATLDKLTASMLEDQMIIQWNTASEINNLGMNLWCAQLVDNQFENITQLNSELIPTKAILPQLGAFYSSADYPTINTHLKLGIQHCTLEDMNAGDQCTLHCDQIKTIVIGEENSILDVELNELNAKAIALCNQSQLSGVCLAQRFAPN